MYNRVTQQSLSLPVEPKQPQSRKQTQLIAEMLIRPSDTRRARVRWLALERPYKHEVMGNGIYSCLRFRVAKQILKHQSSTQKLFLFSFSKTTVSLFKLKKFTFSRKTIYPHRLTMVLAQLFADTLMTRNKKKKSEVPSGESGGEEGTGLRWPVKIWPLGSATVDKGCGHKGPGRKSKSM